MLLRFNLKYCYLFSTILLIEIVIAVFINDTFIRPFVGDILVIVLLYFFVRMLCTITKKSAIISVLVFAYLIELGQYFNLVSILSLQNYTLAKIVIGSTFDFLDLLAYTIGALIVVSSDYFSPHTS